VPAEGVSVTDLRSTTDILLRSGLPIEDVNAVRKHLSEIKGGQLAQQIALATAVTFVVIDEVAGKPWGPTVGDETMFEDALNVLSRHDLKQRVPASVRDHLVSGRESDVPETPDRAVLEDIDAFGVILADLVAVCEAAARHAEALGYEPMILSTSIEGESSEVATVFAGITDEIRTHGRPIEPPCVVVSGGETTVTVEGDAGSGGPNQEFALAYALESTDWADVTLLALGTDGTDRPTEFAGGLIDATTIPRTMEKGGESMDTPSTTQFVRAT
jgi:glycerate-2-kinase